MAQPQQTVCPLCQGRKIIGAPPNAQLCPLCDGTGKNPDPGVFYVLPMPLFTINAGGGSVNAAGAGVPAINLPDNRPFKWIALTGASSGTYNLLVTDSSSQYSFSQVAVPNVNMVGTAQQPFVLPTPYLFIRQIQINVLDTSGAGGNAISLAFVGALIS